LHSEIPWTDADNTNKLGLLQQYLHGDQDWLIPLAESEDTDHGLPIRNTISGGRGPKFYAESKQQED
jgi:hypothetical protein